MKKPDNHTKSPIKRENELDFSYPPSEDIYRNYKEESEIDPENISLQKEPNEEEGNWNEKNFKQDKTGDDLDVPGSEMDDEQENNGSEDEENNYYSIGGDNHIDLEENKGE
jgi:hypothetical protein